MIFADLHIHSWFSSLGAFANNDLLINRLGKLFPKQAFPEKDLFLGGRFSLFDGICQPEEIVRQAAEIGLKAISVTDHNSLLGTLSAKSFGKKYSLTVISGMEISTKDGEILAYGIKKKIPARLTVEETVDLIRRQGGVAVVAHPFGTRFKNPLFRRLSIGKIKEASFDGIEVANYFTGRISNRFVKIAGTKKISLLGSSDAHDLSALGCAKTGFPDGCRSEQDFIEAIRKAQTVPVAGGINWLKTAADLIWFNTFGRREALQSFSGSVSSLAARKS